MLKIPGRNNSIGIDSQENRKCFAYFLTELTKSFYSDVTDQFTIKYWGWDTTVGVGDFRPQLLNIPRLGLERSLRAHITNNYGLNIYT